MSSRVIYSRRIIRKIGDNHPVGPRTFSAREHEKHALQTPRAGAIILADMFEANMQLEYKKTWTSMPSNEALLLQQTQQRASFAGGTAIQALHSLSSRKAKPSAICTCLSFHAFGFFVRSTWSTWSLGRFCDVQEPYNNNGLKSQTWPNARKSIAGAFQRNYLHTPRLMAKRLSRR